MAAIQLNFTLRTSSNVKTVHLLGSWDNYTGQLPLSKDSAKAGGWKGTFRFQGATLQLGQRYWYYYIVDGYHVSHDPAREFVTEPTTGRKLNVLDIPAGKAGAAAPAAKSSSAKRQSRRVSADMAHGRSLSPSKIMSPKPIHPNQTKQLVNGHYEHATVDALTSRFSQTTLDEDEDESEDDSEYDSDSGSDVPSLTSRSSNSSSPSSVSSTSSCCTCERYGITRAGDRVKLDCGGARCGSSDESDCSSEDEEAHYARATRRQGLVIRS